MSRDDATLLDVVGAARLACGFIEGMDRAGFESDLKTQSAILHQLLIIGEATKRLSDGFRGTLPDVPWSEMAGMRDRLIHGYDAVDLDEVWRTVVRDLPDLVRVLAPYLPRAT